MTDTDAPKLYFRFDVQIPFRYLFDTLVHTSLEAPPVYSIRSLFFSDNSLFLHDPLAEEYQAKVALAEPPCDLCQDMNTALQSPLGSHKKIASPTQCTAYNTVQDGQENELISL